MWGGQTINEVWCNFLWDPITADKCLVIECIQRSTSWEECALPTKSSTSIVSLKGNQNCCHFDGVTGVITLTTSYVSNAPFTQDGDLCATFERPKNGQDAQWSPNHRKSCFCVTAPATTEAEASPRLTGKFAAERIDYLATIGRPLCLHSATTAMLVPPFCNHGNACASLLPPLSNQPPRRPLCDCFEHVQKFAASMAMSEPPVYHLWTT